jgi:hypothetical protein
MRARPLPSFRGPGIAALATAAVLAGSSVASGASIAIVDPSPANGARVQTTDKGATLTFAWSADNAGCTRSSSTVTLRFGGARPFVRTVGNALPTGSLEVDFRTSTAEDTFTWTAAFTCNSLEDTVSETRSFTNLPPDPAPRLAGKYLPSARGIATRNWTLSPRCRSGACNTYLKIPGQPRFLLKYNARKRTYTGTLKRAKATCRRGFLRTVRNGYRGSIRVQVRVTDTTVSGARTFASTLRGRVTNRFRPTARAKRIGCRNVNSRTALTLRR